VRDSDAASRELDRGVIQRSVAVLGWLSLVLLAASCGPAGGLDVAELEAELKSELLVRYPAAVSSVACPEPLDPVAGDQVICQVQIGGCRACVQ